MRAQRRVPKPILHPLCAQLRQKRIERGYSQYDLSFALGYSTNTVIAWENGYRIPTIASLIDWAGYLGFKLRLEEVTPKER